MTAWQGNGPDPGPQLGVRQELASSARREAAFYAIAKMWGLNAYVPRAEVLVIDGQEVAAIKMLPFYWTNLAEAAKDDANLPLRVMGPYREVGLLHKWAVLDGVLGSPDRHGQNIMVSPPVQNNWNNGYFVALIDHGSAFAGFDFDPTNDSHSFVPYYLRIFAPEFSKNIPEERYRYLPRLSSVVDNSLRDWILSLNEDKLRKVLIQYGINPSPSCGRLMMLQLKTKSSLGFEIVNKLWCGLDTWRIIGG